MLWLSARQERARGFSLHWAHSMFCSTSYTNTVYSKTEVPARKISPTCNRQEQTDSNSGVRRLSEEIRKASLQFPAAVTASTDTPHKVSMVTIIFFWGLVIAAFSCNIFRLLHQPYQASLLFQQHQHNFLSSPILPAQKDGFVYSFIPCGF